MYEGILLTQARAKNVAIVKTNMQLVLGKKQFGNEQIYRKFNVCQIFNRNKKNYEKTHGHDFESFHCLHTGAAHKNRKRLILPRWFQLCDLRKNLTSEFHVWGRLKLMFSTEISTTNY